MKLKIIEEALKMYEARGDHDDQTQADIANCWIELAEMKKPEGVDAFYCEDVDIIPTLLTDDLCNRLLYDTYGRIARTATPDSDIVAEFIDAVHTKEYLAISDLLLTDLCYFLHDLWSDNEATGDNNLDGTFKRN